MYGGLAIGLRVLSAILRGLAGLDQIALHQIIKLASAEFETFLQGIVKEREDESAAELRQLREKVLELEAEARGHKRSR